jgi:predicted dehydrogenase
MTALRFGVVGCGAISEALYLPVLSKAKSICSELHLLDSQPERLAASASKYRANSQTTSLPELIARIDAAVIATPPLTHAPIAEMFVAAGKHVLCEKPMTIRPTDAENLVRLASAANVILMANYQRRGLPTFSRIQKIIQSGELGQPLSVTWVEGNKASWPTRSGYYYTQRTEDGLPGAGVLLDMGAHSVDLLCWWLGTPKVVGCWTDSYGGPDARARLELGFNGTSAQIDLGSYVRMKNTYKLQFEHGTITGLISDSSRFEFVRSAARPLIVKCPPNRGQWSRVLTNFAAVVEGRERPIVAGRDVLPSIRTIAEAYRVAKPFDEPWLPKWSQL